MKKIIAILMSLAMLLCAASAMAEDPQAPQGKYTLGTVNINGAFTLQCGLPEGYTPRPIEVSTDRIIAAVTSEDPNAPVMVVSIAYDEMYADVDRLNDLDEEGLKLLEQTFIDVDPDVEITYGETGYGTLLLVARHESDTLDYITFFSIYKGYCVEFALTPSQTAEDKNLTEEQLKLSIDFLTDLDFLPAGTPANGKQAVAGGKWITNLSDYDADANTVAAVVMHGVPLSAAEAEALKVGDTLKAGQYEEEIQTLEQADDNTILINGEIELRKYGDEYHVYSYEQEYIEPYVTLTLEIPDTLTFLDGINPETGEALDEPTQHTAEEFKAMLAAGGFPDFATDNTWVTFDENGEMVSVERFYSPAQ